MRSPKLDTAGAGAPTPGTRYYAGYSSAFVEDVITHLAIGDREVLLDPWNGAGTTTSVASSQRRPSIGLDINPALLVIAKARLLTNDVGKSVRALTHEVITRAARSPVEINDDDPLLEWFTAGTVEHLRSIEQSIRDLMVNPPMASAQFTTQAALDGLSPLAASFLVVLFEVVRSFLRSYTTTNPTWVRRRGPDEKRISLAREPIAARFRMREAALHAPLHNLELFGADPQDVIAKFILGSSTALPLDDSTVGGVITSPPYMTRIDYAVLTRPELAVLGVNDAEFRALRLKMLGSPTMWSERPKPLPEWGKSATAFLNAVEGHSSKASKSYYVHYFTQYYDLLFRSLKEVARVSAPEARCALVVQDSYYKDIRADLASHIIEMARSIGWSSHKRFDFPVARTKAGMHPGARQYRTDFSATESLIVLSVSRASGV